jgi:hypothetical protein
LPGIAQVQPGRVPLSRPARLFSVWRRLGPGDYELLPNVRVLSIEPPAEGADAGSARFRYSFGDPLGDPDDPGRVEDVYPLTATGPRVVNNDDRLVVRMHRDDGSTTIKFDGFVRTPQADLGRVSESVTFEAAGTPIREWDTPMGAAVLRDASTPTEVDADARAKAVRTRFNPDGLPNMSPADADSGEDGSKFPVFLGPVSPGNAINGATIRPWTVKGAACYIISIGNPSVEFVDYKDLQELTDDLVSIRPDPEDGRIDWLDPTTFVIEEIEVEDLDVTQATWPEALEQLLAPHGFAMRFRLEEEEPGEDAEEGTPTEPKWWLDIYRKDDTDRVKKLYLQEAGEAYSPARTNVLEVKLARDTSGVENMVVLDTVPTLYEASFLLAPGFEPAAGDTPEDFEGQEAGDKYRVWVFDECGEGYWDINTDTWIEGDPGDLRRVLHASDDEDKDPEFARRRRPGQAKLISTDAGGQPRRTIVHYSNNYDGVMPGVWDPDHRADWAELNNSEWELLDDRLGIRIRAQKPNEVKAGEIKEGATDPYDNGGVLNLVEWCARPTAARPFPRFRVTCVIEADDDLRVVGDWRQASSITSRPVARIHDERARYRKRVVGRYSYLTTFARLAKEDFAPVDDTEEAQAYADALRRARESGTFAGSVTLNGVRSAYEVGDRIASIVGRNIQLRTNLGIEEDESPVYPVVVGLRWECDGEQRTVLQLADRRADPPRRRRKVSDT